MVPVPTNDPLRSGIFPLLPSRWEPLIADPTRYNLQIIYTRIDRAGGSHPTLSLFRFNVDERRYFYPASTVKLPVAVLALERVNDLAGLGVTPRSRIDVTNTLPCPILYDNDDGRLPADPVAIESSIKRMLLVSDNGAYNRLWEFLTRDAVNRRLCEAGFGKTRLLHRLSSPCSVEQSRVGNPVRCLDETGRVLFERGRTLSTGPDGNPCAPVSFGSATMAAGTVEPHPFPADHLNRAPLEELHRLLAGIVFPGVGKDRPLRLTAEDRRFLLTWMGLLPREAGMERYRPEGGYPDRYKKYFLYGAGERPVAEGLREYNVIGQAYGFLTDVAYLADQGNGVEFFLAAAIYVNENGIVNDDVYEYESIGKPFFADLCRAAYGFEMRRRNASSDFRSNALTL